MDSTSPLACSLVTAHSRDGLRKRSEERSGETCATIFTLLGFIVTVSLMIFSPSCMFYSKYVFVVVVVLSVISHN